MARSETKAEKFRRLATQRTNAVLEKLRVLGNCANPLIYEYTEEEVNKIFTTIRNRLAKVEGKFQNKKEPEPEFRL